MQLEVKMHTSCSPDLAARMTACCNAPPTKSFISATIYPSVMLANVT